MALNIFTMSMPLSILILDIIIFYLYYVSSDINVKFINLLITYRLNKL